MIFNQIRNRNTARAATGTARLLLGAAAAIGAWVALYVGCLVNLSALPSAREAPQCPCESLPARPQLLREEQALAVLSDALRERRTAAVP